MRLLASDNGGGVGFAVGAGLELNRHPNLADEVNGICDLWLKRNHRRPWDVRGGSVCRRRRDGFGSPAGGGGGV